MPDLSRLLRARSVTLIGASDNNPWCAMVARGLAAGGFEGPVHLVNARGNQALGRETVRSCTDLPEVDAAFIAVPAAAIGAAIEDMAAAGISHGVVVTSGFAELGGEGKRAEERLFGRAAELGVTLMGPNSLGFANLVDKVCLSAIPLRPALPSSGVALVSQSGATSAMLYSFAHQQGIGLTHSVALGNEAMIDLCDVVEFLLDDERVKAVAIFAESIRDAGRFRAIAERALKARKPIVVQKVGVGELTAAVAQAHTGALVGDDRVFQAACDAYGVMRASSIEDLIVTAGLLASTGPIDAEKGFALISASGGACEIAADGGELAGVPFPPFADATRDRLGEVISAYGATHNPFDITGAVMAKPEMYADAVRAIGMDGQFGLIGLITEVGESEAATSPASLGMIRATARGLADIDVPVVLIQQYLKPVSEFGRTVLAEHGLPALTGGLDHAMRALGRLWHWSRRVALPPPTATTATASSAELPRGERATLEFLSGHGVPVIPQRVVRTTHEAAAAAAEIGGSLALKILSPDIAHKTEVGGVALHVPPEEAGAAFERILASARTKCPDAEIQGALVSPMREEGVDLIVGVVRDPVWGLAIAVGLGGIWVELLKDSALRLLPVSRGEARDMLLSLKAAPLLTGYRGTPALDIDRIAEAIVGIGNAAIALGHGLEALEVNPLRVTAACPEALDALAVGRPS